MVIPDDSYGVPLDACQKRTARLPGRLGDVVQQR